MKKSTKRTLGWTLIIISIILMLISASLGYSNYYLYGSILFIIAWVMIILLMVAKEKNMW